ncbi:MAG: SDR family oxidoreductase [Armatimonadetes bacterium]|nr:SDR family oxidoreductase [Armatimonadota bacterium]
MVRVARLGGLINEYHRIAAWMAMNVPFGVPMGRIGMPQELKGLAILLASDASSYMCGDLIMVDGAIVAK